MNRIQLADGAYLSAFPAEKFKRNRISLTFIWSAQRETATAEALLPMMLERGNATCPDMTDMSKKLASLYGAELSVDIAMIGANRVLTVTVTGIRDKYALNSEPLTEEYVRLALDTAFNPYFVNGMFDEDTIEIEKDQLFELLESEVNDKRTYCIRQARRKMFGDAPEGIEKNGYPDEVKQLTAKDVTDAYKHMISVAQLEVIVLGAPKETVSSLLTDALNKVKRSAKPLVPVTFQPRQSEQIYTQPVDASQGKLCMLFTAGELINAENLSVMRLANAVLGGTSTSRLFVNVREKQSLCYYCPSSFTSYTNVMTIDCGIEHKDAQKAKEAILNEFNALCTKEVSDEELDKAKRALLSSYNSIEDTLSGVEFWQFSEIMRGTEKTPADVMKEISNVTKQQVQQMLSKFTLSVTYLLTKEGDE